MPLDRADTPTKRTNTRPRNTIATDMCAAIVPSVSKSLLRDLLFGKPALITSKEERLTLLICLPRDEHTQTFASQHFETG